MLVWGIGEVLWDFFPDEERLGGAALNFCANLQRLGDEAMLFSAVARDARGALALERMAELGLGTAGIRSVDEPPTGVAIVGTTPEGEPSFFIPRPAAFDRMALDTTTLHSAASGIPGLGHAGAPCADWLYFGTLMQTQSSVEEFTTRLARSSDTLRCFYDMNLRERQWNLELVQRLSRLSSILKLNEAEAETLFTLTQPNGSDSSAGFSLEQFCRFWASTYDIEVICVTLGGAGCCVYAWGAMHYVPGFSVVVSDTVGSGDAFAAAFLHGYHRGWTIPETARFANGLGALVASRPGATPAWTLEECLALTGGKHADVSEIA